LKLADFGFACKIDECDNTILGTPDFMSPEMLQNLGYSTPADYWAVGICIYQLLIGESAYPDLEPHELMHHIANTELEFCFPSHFSQCGRDFISGLLTRDPDKRLGRTNNPCREHPWFADMDWESLNNHT